MKTLKKLLLFAIFAFSPFLLIQCDDDDEASVKDDRIKPGPNAQTEVQNALIEAENGDTIKFAEGTFEFNRSLSMDGKTGVVLLGAGRTKTIFDFSKQDTGGDALLVTNSENILAQDFTIQDAKGDALKFKDCNKITMYRIGTTWTGEPSEANGAYGLYPVTSSNILIDECYAFGASDAGIYVGQSDKAIVRNSKAEGNVAGIEIENTTNADVYNNEAVDNTGGVLVFDLPNLSQAGSKTRVFNNTIHNNNRGNFAPSGNIVGEVPAGTGVMILSTNNVEIFNNTITENNVIGVGIFSYASIVALRNGQIDDPNYNPFPKNIYIHNNTFSRSNTYAPADKQSYFGTIIINTFKENPIPDLMIDGFFDPMDPSSANICFKDNSTEAFFNMNVPSNMEKPSYDITPHRCSGSALPEVTIDAPLYK